MVSQVDRFARFGGIAFLVLFLVGIGLAGDAGLADGSKIAAYFSDHRINILIGMHLGGIGLLAFTAWSWWLMRVFASAEPGTRDLGLALFIFGAATAVVEFGVIAAYMTLALISNQEVNPVTARTFANLGQVFSYVDYFPLAGFFLAFGLVALKSHRVAAWSALVLVPACLIAAAPSLKLDRLMALPTFLWVLAASVSLIRSERPVSLASTP